MKPIISLAWKKHLISIQNELVQAKLSNWKRARTKLTNGTGSKGTLGIALAVLDREIDNLNAIRNTPVAK